MTDKLKKMVGGHILIRLDDEEIKTKSGIFLPDAGRKLPSRGTVELVADNIKSVKVGDHVEFLRYASIDGFDNATRICKEEHIVGVYGSKTA